MSQTTHFSLPPTILVDTPHSSHVAIAPLSLNADVPEACDPLSRTHATYRAHCPPARTLHGGAGPRLCGVTTRIAKPSVGSIKQKRGAHGEQQERRGVTDASASAGPHPHSDIGARHKNGVRGERKSGRIGARALKTGEPG
ncbi:hypothetical protein C8J57DRAFT_1505250 [Mycena rebaudengoi]|nr:hypothetical protein C8J57DRAFT_1505250 [Mycena rebaudengoi]